MEPLKALCRPIFEAALREVLFALLSRKRNLLELHHVEHLDGAGSAAPAAPALDTISRCVFN